MSYILSSSRPFDQPAHADIPQHPPLSPPASQNGRLPMPPASYPAYSSPSSSHHPASYSPDRQPISLPKVGQTRCYWALLNSELQFIYLDPVLASHLEEQAELLIGRSLLSFVHPDEQSSAKNDLGSVVESRTLHGSVTRVRFSRLSRVRRQLGYTGPLVQWSDADKIAVDANYMAVDIVINWAAEGLVLCFIHAIVDLTPNDNDEQNKTGWTNWCGTPLMDTPQIQLLYQRLLNSVPQPRIVDRVFQILANREGRPLLISWPPDQGQRPIGSDFAQLVENAQIGNGMPDGNDAKTSCTRRYKALQTMPSLVGAQVESIFIPHGSVIFACHKVDSPSRSTASTTSTMQLGYSSASYSTQQPSPYYEQGTTYLPPLTAHSPYSANYPPPHAQPVPAGYAPQRWSQGEGSYSQWASSSPANAASPLPPAVSNLRSGSYPPPPPNPSWQTPSSSYVEAGNAVPPFNRSISPNYSYPPAGAGSEGASPSPDVVPPARRRISPSSGREQYSSGSSRSTGNRPTGILKCSSCKATTSPEWRKGPSGKKELCNACGLRYARSRAKKEGQNQPQRRRKDKGITKRDSATPPTSASPSFSAMRRSYVETSFVSTSSTGSNSGSEIYHPVHHLLDHSTPSPSPPSSSMSFVHYSPGSDTRQSYSNPSGSFYSAPSPLSNTHVLHPQEQGPPAHPSQQQQQQQQQHRTNQLPPLGEISSYVDRLSPMHPSASPVPHSPLATLPPASFERERDRDRELPPAPLSVEPRHSRRSILTQQ